MLSSSTVYDHSTSPNLSPSRTLRRRHRAGTSPLPQSPPSRPQFDRVRNSSLGSPFLTTADDSSDYFGELDFVDGSLTPVPRRLTITRPPSPDFSIIDVPRYQDCQESYATTSIFGTPIAFRRTVASAAYSAFQNASPDRTMRSFFPRLWEVFSSPSKQRHSPRVQRRSTESLALPKFDEKGKGRECCEWDSDDDDESFSFDYVDTSPLDDDEGELIEDEACFVEVTAITGIDIIALLPAEVSLHILNSFLDLPAVLSCLCVSKTWRKLAEDNSVWHSLFQQNAGRSWSVDLSRWRHIHDSTRRQVRNQDAKASFDLVLEEWSRRRNINRLPSHSSEPVISRGQYSTSPRIRGRSPILQQAQLPRSLSMSAVDCLKSSALLPPLAFDWRTLYEDRHELDQRWGTSQSEKSRSDWEPEVLRLAGHNDSVYCLEFDSTKIITGSRDRTIKVWSLRTAELLATFKGHHASVLCLTFEKDWDCHTTADGEISTGCLISGSSDCSVRVWDMHTHPDGTLTGNVRAVLKGHRLGVLDIRMDDQRIVSCSKDTTVRVWDRHSLMSLRVLRGHEGPVNAIGLQGDRVVSASGDGKMILWDLNTGNPVRTYEGHNRGLACVDFKGDLIVSGSNDSKIKVWSAVDGRCISTLTGHTNLVRALSFDPASGRLVSASYDRTIKVWDLYSGKVVKDLAGVHSSHIFDVQFDVTRIVSASHDRSIVVMDFSLGLDTSLFV